MKVKSTIAAPILILLIFISNIILNLLPESVLGGGNDKYITAAFLQIFILGLPAVIFCRLRGSEYTKKMRLRGFAPGNVPLLLLAFFLIFCGSSLINFTAYKLFPSADLISLSYKESGMGGLYLILAAGIIPAITEEFLFRGVILCEYESEGIPAAVIMSSLFFAMLHGSAAGSITYLFCGIVLAMTLYATRSLAATTLVHMLSNTATILFGDIIYRVVSRQGIVLFVFALISLSLLSLILFLGECERIYATLSFMNTDSSHWKKRKKWDNAYGIFRSIVSPPFMIFVIIFIIVAAVGL